MSFTSGSIDSIEQGTEIGLSQSFPNIDTNIDFESNSIIVYTEEEIEAICEHYLKTIKRLINNIEEIIDNYKKDESHLDLENEYYDLFDDASSDIDIYIDIFDKMINEFTKFMLNSIYDIDIYEKYENELNDMYEYIKTSYKLDFD